MVLRWRPMAIEAAEQHLGGSPSDSGRVLGDDGDAGLEEVGEQDVVEADQGHTRMQSEPSEGAEGPDSNQVLSGEEGGRRVRAAEQFVRGRFGLFDSTQVETHDSFVELDLLLGQLFGIAAVTIGGGGDAAQVAQITDADMPLLDQMAEPASHPGRIVSEDRVVVEKRS